MRAPACNVPLEKCCSIVESVSFKGRKQAGKFEKHHEIKNTANSAPSKIPPRKPA